MTAPSLAIGFAAGTLATLVAAWTPVRSAVRVPPVAALRDAATEPPSPGRVRIALGAVLAAAGAAVAVPAAGRRVLRPSPRPAPGRWCSASCCSRRSRCGR